MQVASTMKPLQSSCYCSSLTEIFRINKLEMNSLVASFIASYEVNFGVCFPDNFTVCSNPSIMKQRFRVCPLN